MKTVTVSALTVSAFTLISAPVSAADMAVKAPPSSLPPSAPAYTWTGCYDGDTPTFEQILAEIGKWIDRL